MEQRRLRPMGIGEIFDQAYFSLRQNFKALVNIHIVTFLPFYSFLLLILVIFLSVYLINPIWLENLKNLSSPSDAGGAALMTMGVMLVAFILIAILSIVLLFCFFYNNYGILKVFDISMDGNKISRREALRGSLLGVVFFFCDWLILSIGIRIVNFFFFFMSIPIRFLALSNKMAFFNTAYLILILIINFLLASFLMVVFPIVALEKKDPITAIGRSVYLVWKNFWRTLVIYLLNAFLWIAMVALLMIVFAVPFIIWFIRNGQPGVASFNWYTLLDPWLIGISLAFLILFSFVAFLLYNFSIGIQSIVLNDYRMRCEGYDILQQQVSLDRGK